jgi:hypothetical protein
MAESPLLSSTTKILCSGKNLSTAALDVTGVFLYFDTSPPPPNPSPHLPPPRSPFPISAITHCRSTYLSVAWGAWLPLPLTPNLPPRALLGSLPFISVPVTFWASLIQIHYFYGSESFYLLLNFLNDHSGLAVKMLLR